MSRPTLLAVAHGSKDPAAKATITALAREVNRFAPVLKVRVAFIQHAEPSLDDELSAAGENAVIVPLLLSTGYHLATDIAGAASAAGRPGGRPARAGHAAGDGAGRAAGRGGRAGRDAGGAGRGRLDRPGRASATRTARPSCWPSGWRCR